jgi:SAM-dependent methyltransferase
MDPREYALMDAAEGHMWWYRALQVRLADALDGVQGRVLDAGCGSGGLLAVLERLAPSLDLVGLEWAEAPARRAREKSSAALARGSINTLPFAGGSFDAVIAADVLCHREVDPLLALAEIHRVLRPGGRLVVNMPAYAWLASAHDRRVHNARRWTARHTGAVLRLAGFGEVRARYWNGLLLPLMVVQRKLLARGEDAASDVASFSPWLDATLHAITVIERRLAIPLPAGGSVLATAIRPPEQRPPA